MVVTTVVVEVCYLLDKYLGSAVKAEFLRNIARGELIHVDLAREDFARMAELVQQYADLPLGGTDASLVAVAERSGIDTVATFDRRHFTVVRPGHAAAFTLLPT